MSLLETARHNRLKALASLSCKSIMTDGVRVSVSHSLRILSRTGRPVNRFKKAAFRVSEQPEMC